MFSYDRQGLVLHLVIKSMNNHEIRELCVGLWSRLDRDDQIDHIRELTHYYQDEPGTRLSGIAEEIRRA
jgi:hypothetical protein